MSIDYIRRAYNMPNLKRGLGVTFNGQEGRIISCTALIRIKLNNGKKIYVHPKEKGLEIIGN